MCIRDRDKPEPRPRVTVPRLARSAVVVDWWDEFVKSSSWPYILDATDNVGSARCQPNAVRSRRRPWGRLSFARLPRPSNMKLLFDFLPILLFFIAYKLADIYVATGVLIGVTSVSYTHLDVYKRQVHGLLLSNPLQYYNFFTHLLFCSSGKTSTKKINSYYLIPQGLGNTHKYFPRFNHNL